LIAAAPLRDTPPAPVTLGLAGASRRNLMEAALALLTVGILLGVSFRTLAPFISSLLWAVIMAVPAWPVADRLALRFGGRRTPAALLIGAALFVILSLPLIYLSLTLGEVGQDAWSMLSSVVAQGLPEPPAFVAKLPLVGARLVKLWNQDIHNLPTLLTDSQSVLIVAGQLAFRQMTDLVSAVGEILFGTLLAVQLLMAGPPVLVTLERFALMVGGRTGTSALEVTRQAILAVALGLVATALVEAALSGLGFWLAGLPLAAVFAFACFVLRVLQIGPWPVWILAVLGLWWWQPGHGAALFLGPWLVLGVAGVTRLLGRYMVTRHKALPGPLLFLAALGGLLTWGFSGMFLGTAAIAVVWSLLIDWLRVPNEEAGQVVTG